MTRLDRLGAAAWLALGAFVVMESTLWIRHGADSLFETRAPTVAMDREGRVHRLWTRRVGDGGASVTEVRFADAGGVPGPWVRQDTPEAWTRLKAARVRSSVFAYLDAEARSGVFPDAPWFEGSDVALRRDPLHGLAAAANAHEVTRRARPMRDAQGTVYPDWAAGNVHLTWAAEDGRVVARAPTGDLLAAFGIDGWRSGADASSVRPFVGLRAAGNLPFVWVGPTHTYHGRRPLPESDRVYVDGDGAAVFVRLDPDSETPPAPDAPLPPPLQPLRVGVRRVALPDGPLHVLPGRLPWRSRPSSAPGILVLGREVVAVASDGRVERLFTMDADEVFSWASLETQPDVVDASTDPRDRTDDLRAVPYPAFASVFGAPEPMRYRVRLRLRPPGGDWIVGEDELTAANADVGAAPHLLRTVAAIARPPLLNALAAAAPAPQSWRALAGAYWLDPIFAGSHGLAWLAASLLVAAGCGGIAWRSARLRAPDRAAVWTATCAALGPLGLAWMAHVVRRDTVRPCDACPERRAVDVPACPACAAPWAPPARRGVEIVR